MGSQPFDLDAVNGGGGDVFDFDAFQQQNPINLDFSGITGMPGPLGPVDPAGRPFHEDPRAAFGRSVLNTYGRIGATLANIPGARGPFSVGEGMEDVAPPEVPGPAGFAGRVAANIPLSLAGGAGFGAAGVLPRVGLEAARGAAMTGLEGGDPVAGALFGAAGQGMGEGLSALAGAAPDLARRFTSMAFDVPESMAATGQALPGVTAGRVTDAMLDTGALTPQGLQKATAGGMRRAQGAIGDDLATAVREGRGGVDLDTAFPPQLREIVSVAANESPDGLQAFPAIMEAITAPGGGVLNPVQAQALKVELSEFARLATAGQNPFTQAVARTSAGSVGGQLRGAVPNYDDLMSDFQTQMFANAAARGGPNRTLSSIAGRGVGGAAGSVAGPWGMLAGAHFGGNRDLGGSAILSLLQMLRNSPDLLRSLSGIPQPALETAAASY